MDWREVTEEERQLIKSRMMPKEIRSLLFTVIIDIILVIFVVYSAKSDIELPDYAWDGLSKIFAVTFYIFALLILILTIRSMIMSVKIIQGVSSVKMKVADCVLEEVEKHFMGRKVLTNVTIRTDSGVRRSMSYTSSFTAEISKGAKGLLVNLGSRKEKDWKLVLT